MTLKASAPQRVDGHVTPVPTHVAIIMDGNGRWAQRQGKPRPAGHRAGTENVRRVVKALGKRGVRYTTLFAFSTENWGRPEEEVSELLSILESVIDEEVQKLHEANVRVRHLGSRERLSGSLSEAIVAAEELTKSNTAMTLCLAFDYGGRAELVDVVRRIVAAGTPPHEITEQTVRDHLYLPDVPDPDLIIRTAGDQRISNFLVWQSAYSEFYGTPTYWPDFDDAEVERALDEFGRRQRRYGKLPSET